MAYDEGLAQRIREHLKQRPDVEEKNMFGGLCFMVAGHICCGIVGDTLMARVGPDNYASCLHSKYAREMDFTGKAMKGMVYVSPAGIAEDQDLSTWLDKCCEYVNSLPPR